jgi:hypothetical protein
MLAGHDDPPERVVVAQSPRVAKPIEYALHEARSSVGVEYVASWRG